MLDLLGNPAMCGFAQQIEAELAAPFGERGDGQVLAHRQPGEQLVDLIALGQAELAHVGDVHAGDVVPSNTIVPEVG